MTMKNSFMKQVVIGVLIALMSFGPALAFESSSIFNGFSDDEYTPAMVAGEPIVKGEWVVVAIGSALTTGATSGYRMDTCVVAVTSPATENYGLVRGVALQSADTGQYVQVMTQGYCLAYVDGSDSSAAGGISAAAPLSLTDKAGYAGAAAYVSGTTPTATQAATTKIIGYALYDIAITDTTSLHRVYVTGR